MAATASAGGGTHPPGADLLVQSTAKVAQFAGQLRVLQSQTLTSSSSPSATSSQLEEVIVVADKMLQELRTGDLSPKQYYELNLRIVEELRQMQGWLIELEKKSLIKMVELYQRVQYVSAVLPRLYLMCTVGAAYCSLSGSPAREVMKDMLEMCKCVQHPCRGLFLRNYLSQLTKDKLQLLGGPRERCEFVLQNFSEMTRLWVRMQPPKKKSPLEQEEEEKVDPKELKRKQELRDRREVERKQLCQIIGQNLFRLSDSITDLETYEQVVLPRVLEIIIQSGDGFAQTYLSDVLCQVIPNRFQLATLDTFLATVCNVEEMQVPGMDFQQVLSSLMDRLAEELNVTTSTTRNDDDDDVIQSFSASKVFDSFFDNISKLCTTAKSTPTSTSLSLKDALALHVALLKFQSKVEPKRLDRVDTIFGSIVETLDRSAESQARTALEPNEETCIVDLLRAPFDNPAAGADILGVLQLSRFPKLLNFLSFENRKLVAGKLLKAVVHSPETVEDGQVCERLFDFVNPLFSAAASSSTEEDEEIRLQDQLLAKTIHKFHHEDPNELFKLLSIAKDNLQKCPDDVRLSRIMVPLCFRGMELLKAKSFTAQRQVLQQIHEICTNLGNSEVNSCKDIACRVFTYACLACDKCTEDLEMVAYECIVSAFSIFENLADSKLQANLVPFLVGSVQTLTSFSKDNLDVLQAKTALYAAQLLKKTDQCRHVALSAHLFWSNQPERQLREGEQPPIPGRNSKRALECLQRSLKIADALQQSNNAANKAQSVALFVEILNQYIYFLNAGADKIKAQYITDLIALINEQMLNANPPMDFSVENFYRRTMAHLRRLAAKGGKFAEFSVSSIGAGSSDLINQNGVFNAGQTGGLSEATDLML